MSGLILCQYAGHKLSEKLDVTVPDQSTKFEQMDSIVSQEQPESNLLGKRERDDGSGLENASLDANLSTARSAVEDILMQLSWLSVAIRRSGTSARAEKADREFSTNNYEKLRRYLERLLTIVGQQNGGPFVDPRPLTQIQQRLVSTNLRRRHRFKHAQQHSTALSRGSNNDEGCNTLSPNHLATDPNTAPKANRTLPQESGHRETVPSHVQPKALVTSTVATEQRHSMLGVVQQKRQQSVTSGLSATGAKLDYPLPPTIKPGLRLFRCPCCCQILPIEIASSTKGKWRFVKRSLDQYIRTC